MSVREVTIDNFSTITNEPGLKLLRFWASWCAPCMMMEPMYKNAAQALKDSALLAEVDTVQQPELATMHGVRSIPTVIVYKDGEIVDRISGLMNEKELASLVDTLKD